MAYKDLLNNDFRSRLFNTIQEIEKASHVEIVVVSAYKSLKYNHYFLWFAFFMMAAVYTFFMFAPAEFNVYLIYFFTVLSFPAFYFLAAFVPGIVRPFVSKKEMSRNVEIYARALFQKGGIHHTQDKIGVLFFISYFEKRVFILPDKGAEISVPAEIWENWEKDFDKIFKSANIAEAFLEKLSQTKEIFARYIPITPDDINELPDDLQIDL